MQTIARYFKLGACSILAASCGSVTTEKTWSTSAALTTTLWASPVGSGTSCAQSTPCSLTQAQQAVRGINVFIGGNIVVNLLDGTYQLSAPLSFGPADSGTNGTVTWQAATNATPVISGGAQIAGWTQTQGKPGLWQANVGVGFQTRQLYVDGVRAPRAGGLLPATVTLTATGTGYTASDQTLAGWRNPQNIEFEYSGAAWQNGRHWTDSRCPIAEAIGRNPDGTATITMTQTCWGNLTTAGIPIFGSLAGLAPTRVDNAFELLDEPGEWYLDSGAGTLYYMPWAGQDLRSATVIAPVLETLVNVSGTLDTPVHDISFVGLTFAYATWLRPAAGAGFAEMQGTFTQTDISHDGSQGSCNTGATAGACANPASPSCCPFGSWTKTPANVTVHAGHNIRFDGDTFTHLGGTGVGFEYGSSGRISGSVLTDISGTAIQAGGTDDPTPVDARATVSNLLVVGNYIHDLPVEYLGGVGIFAGYTSGLTIQANQINNTSYSGISIGWGGWARTSTPDPASLQNVSRNNVIRYNHVFNILQDLIDGSALYSNGYRGSQVSNGDMYVANHFHDQFHAGFGVYDDIGSRFISIAQQVFYNVPAPWGGCAASGDLSFVNGFWSPPDTLFVCSPAPGFSITSSNDTTLAAPDPAVDCEANALCAAIIAGAGSAIADGRGEATIVDDQDSSFTYTPTWTSDLSNPANEIKGTRHYTNVKNDAFQFTFQGTGVDYIAELDSNRGLVAISVDGLPYETVNCRAQQLIANQVAARVRGLGPGRHTLKVANVDTNGAFASVDAVRAYTAGPEGMPLDDTNAALSYSGASWASITRNTYGEYQNTLHYATANGDSYTVSFTGTGATLFGDKDPNRGAADVYVDGAFVESINAAAQTTLSQQRLFGVQGLTQTSHTITLYKRGGAYMDIDRVDVYATATVNDDDPSISYIPLSAWTDSENRPYGDYGNDVHYTTMDGASASFSFTGSGVELIAETSSDRGVVDVRVDGIPRGRIFNYSGGLATQQTVYRLHGLRRDSHNIVLTKRGGTYMTVDAFKVVQ